MYKIIVVGNMSAGKSSFINALVGRKINKSQNLACTSSIRAIYNKKKDNVKAEVMEGDTCKVFFKGMMSGTDFVILDTPGVNSSLNIDHKDITFDAIQKKDYDLIVMLMNVTQLGTEDDDCLLDFIKENAIAKKKIFLINKIDYLNPDEENIVDIIKKQSEYLIYKGFQAPIVCPISAKAALTGYSLIGKNISKLSRNERQEFDFMCYKMRTLDIKTYFKKNKKDLYNAVPHQRKKKVNIPPLVEVEASCFYENSLCRSRKVLHTLHRRNFP